MNMFKKNGGFTLVELIVVIAILAILAGVAIPAYSGYMTKANEAADTQLVAAINTAFAAACAENGIAPSQLTNVTATVANKVVTGVTVSDNLADGVAAAIASDFADYYAGNAAAFKYFTGVTFASGTFTGTAPTGN